MSESSGTEPVYEACEGCGALMDVTAFGPFDAVICPTCSVETHVKKDFGAYQLTRRFAVGGMSVIFVGWDSTLNREVAIKVLNEQFCHDEKRIKAFENEARLTAQVSHPNVVKVFAVGRAYDRFYLVMELLKGRSFERTIAKRGALPEGEVLDIALQVAAGLQAAKDAGMIHRDVKPGNIHLDSSNHARLLDFGLALITQEGRVRANEVWATPYYVPPEALEQGIEDFRSDLYAFGASLYHALYGRPPFESTSTSNTILRRAKQTIPRLCQAAPWVSPATGEVIDRMMAFQPGDRWASYAEVIKALEQAKKARQEGPGPPVHSQTRIKRRKRKAFLAPVMVVLILIISGSLAVWQPWQQEDPTASPTPSAPATNSFEVTVFNPGGRSEAELFDSWKMAREAVRQGDFQRATTLFGNLARQPSLAGMPLVWASFEGAVASALDGKPAQARQFVERSLADLDQISRQRSRQRNYREIAEVLRQITPPEEADFPETPDDVIGWMGTFALALKQWDHGDWKSALPALARVRGATLPEELSWFRTYQDLADVYLADGVILTRLDGLAAPETAEEAGARIEDLGKAGADLRTVGRAPFNLKARQEYLSRLQRQLQKASR